ncbi:MAG: hypothetical protein N3A38_06365 [Planctomycetota bacterium]|nr:hypothetical protein [Planctomycetota bacterium]
MKARVKDETKNVRKAVRLAMIDSLGRAGAYVRGIARRSIKVSPEYSKPGKPPHTRQGRLKRGILYAVDRAIQSALIGPSASAVGRIGSIHEFGGTETRSKKARAPNWKLEVGGHGPIQYEPGGKPKFAKLRTEAQVERAKKIVESLPPSLGGPGTRRARRYPPRPFMGPALERARPRLARFWARSVR